MVKLKSIILLSVLFSFAPSPLLLDLTEYLLVIPLYSVVGLSAITLLGDERTYIISLTSHSFP